MIILVHQLYLLAKSAFRWFIWKHVNGVPVIVIDNTNFKPWEMGTFLNLAPTNNYAVIIVKPWSRDADKLAKFNKHGVTADIIGGKLRAFEDIIPLYYGCFLYEQDSKLMYELGRKCLLECVTQFPQPKDKINIDPLEQDITNVRQDTSMENKTVNNEPDVQTFSLTEKTNEQIPEVTSVPDNIPIDGTGNHSEHETSNTDKPNDNKGTGSTNAMHTGGIIIQKDMHTKDSQSEKQDNDLREWKDKEEVGVDKVQTEGNKGNINDDYFSGDTEGRDVQMEKYEKQMERQNEVKETKRDDKEFIPNDEAGISEKNKHLKTIKTKIEEAKVEQRNLVNNIGILKEELTRLTDGMSENEGNLKTIKTEIEEAKVEQRNLVNKIGILKDELTRLTDGISENEGHLKTIKMKNEEAQMEQRKLVKNIGILKDELPRLTDLICEKKTALQTIIRQQRTANTDHNNIISEIKTSEAQLVHVKDVLSESEGSLKTIRMEIEESKEERRNLVNQICIIKGKLQRLNEQEDNPAREIQELQGELHVWTAETTIYRIWHRNATAQTRHWGTRKTKWDSFIMHSYLP